MAYAHSRGVVHRDLKPENIMVGDFGEVLVLDWGLAKVLTKSKDASDSQPGWVLDGNAEDTLEGEYESYAGISNAGMTMEGDMLGTPAFMAPEQAKGKLSQIGPRSDIYALGGILYAIFCLKTA